MRRRAGNRFQPQRLEARLDFGGVQRRHQGFAERGDCFWRRGGGHHQSLPGIGFKALQALLVQRRQGVEGGNALGAGNANRHQPAGLDVLVAAGGVDEHHRHLATNHVLHRRCRSPVADMHHLESVAFAEQFGRQVVRAARARRGVVHATGLLFGPGQELGQVLGRHIRIDHQDHREARHQADRREVFFDVVAELGIQRRVGRHGGGVAGQHDIAVGPGLSGIVGTNVGGRAGLVVDDDRLAQRPAHGQRQNARHHVRAAACRVGNDPFDGFFRIRGGRCQRQGKGGSADPAAQGAGVVHENSSDVRSFKSRKSAPLQQKNASPDRQGRPMIEKYSCAHNWGMYSPGRCFQSGGGRLSPIHRHPLFTHQRLRRPRPPFAHGQPAGRAARRVARALRHSGRKRSRHCAGR